MNDSQKTKKELISELNALRLKEINFRLITETAKVGIWQTDLSGNFIFVNEAFTNFIGYKNEEIIDKNFLILVPKNDIRRSTISFNRAITLGKSVETEFIFKHKNGHLFPGFFSTVPITIEGKIVGLTGVMRDLTEQKMLSLEKSSLNDKIHRALLEIANVSITKNFRLNNLINKTLKTTYSIFKQDRLSIWLPNEKGFYLAGYKGKSENPEGLDFLSSIEFSKYLKFMKENHLLISNNVIKDKRLLELKEYFAVTGTKSMLDASAVIEKKLVVIICFERLSIKEWSTEEIAYMRGLSDQLTQIFLRLKESKSQYKLKDSEQKLNRFFDFAPIGIAINQMDGTFSKVNAEFSRITGYTSEELNKLSYWDLTPKEYTKEEEVQIKNIGETKAYGPYEKEYIRKNGKRIPVLLRGIIIQSGGEDFIWSVVEDITEIKKYRNNLETIVQERTEELNIALEDAENARDNIDAILKSIADGLIVTDIQNRVVLMNRVAEDLLKIKLSEVINRSIYYAIKDKTLRNLIKNTFDKIDTESQFDFKLAGKDLNQHKTLRARASIIKDKKGNNNGIIFIIQDISQEREIDKMKTEFISTAAHELRTPLTSIQGFSEILLTRDDISDQEKKKFLGHINNQATNLAQIINDLLDISRIESGSGYILEKEPCLIGEAIKSVVEPIITQTKIHKFEVVVHKKPVEIIVDKEKMAQVLENLISNAVKYSPDGGKIQIKGEIIKENYQVSIQDEGVGMTREQVEKIFDKFYRADTTNTAIEGTGLGMSIVKNIVEAHDGKVWVESEIGKGTKVTFIIPLDQNVEQLM